MAEKIHLFIKKRREKGFSVVIKQSFELILHADSLYFCYFSTPP